MSVNGLCPDPLESDGAGFLPGALHAVFFYGGRSEGNQEEKSLTVLSDSQL